MEPNQHSKQKDHFGYALVVVFLAIFISLIGFMSEDNKLTGYATATEPNYSYGKALPSNVKEFNSVKLLGTLAPGNYFIDENGVVYWTDDSSKPAVAKVIFVDDAQKNRQIYIDDDGNVGYLIS